MVGIRSVPESDVAAVRRLHNQYTASDESVETVRRWYRARPELFVGAYDCEELVGYCLGGERTVERVELEGIGVARSHRRRGVGTQLLGAFEERAAALGFERVGLGSAGGYVDEFYHGNGYSPESVLVRLDSGDEPPDCRSVGYEVVDETVTDGVRKLYVDVDEFDPAFVEAVGEAFGDPDAIYVVSKELDPCP